MNEGGQNGSLLLFGIPDFNARTKPNLRSPMISSIPLNGFSGRLAFGAINRMFQHCWPYQRCRFGVKHLCQDIGHTRGMSFRHNATAQHTLGNYTQCTRIPDNAYVYVLSRITGNSSESAPPCSSTNPGHRAQLFPVRTTHRTR